MPPLCDKVVVAQACVELSGTIFVSDEDGASMVSAVDISERIMMSVSSVVTFLQAISVTNLEQDHSSVSGGSYVISCSELCHRIVESAPDSELPPSSDVGCYMSSSGDRKCDVDLSPDAVADIPFPLHKMAGEAEADHHYTRMASAATNKLYDGVEAEVRVAIARLFRIYLPTVIGVELSARTSQDSDDLKKATLQAQAVVSTALRAMSVHSVPHLVEKWFGNNDAATRVEIRHLLSGALDRVLSNIEYRFPGPACSSQSYAYIYATNPPPCLDISKCARDALAYRPPYPYIVELCDLYFNSAIGARIKTIIHESLHHHPMAVDDRVYGMHESISLARTDALAALDNSDNFCYFVADANVAWAKALRADPATCFPGDASVLVAPTQREGEVALPRPLPLSVLEVGDHVLVEPGRFEPIIGFLHVLPEGGAPRRLANFELPPVTSSSLPAAAAAPATAAAQVIFDLGTTCSSRPSHRPPRPSLAPLRRAPHWPHLRCSLCAS
eukprot:TRINITY_DN18030_c0_g1_i2.p1 TRINITY_DN18030_c0_g1~~TRINITY_DN18030_c0_g1_i2.p1  ORF type:complete len:580 (-),score=75.70 TRINITY_DN18030_c0_g1_i2:498-2000(-)